MQARYQATLQPERWKDQQAATDGARQERFFAGAGGFCAAAGEACANVQPSRPAGWEKFFEKLLALLFGDLIGDIQALGPEPDVEQRVAGFRLGCADADEMALSISDHHGQLLHGIFDHISANGTWPDFMSECE